MNGDTEKFYLGVLTLAPGDCKSPAALHAHLVNRSANCGIIFSAMKKNSKTQHFTICWIGGYANDQLAYYDSLQHFEGPCTLIPEISDRNFMLTKAGVIYGNTIHNR
jgi:hypothetical protein